MFTVTRTRYLKIVMAAFLSGYGVFLAWQEWLFRQSVVVPALKPAHTEPPPVSTAFNPDAIASVLGFSPRGALVQSPESLVLRASFVSSQGPSQALLDDASEARFYTVGERLPGGSVLRRVEVSYVVLLRNGREERLGLKPAAQYLLPDASLNSLKTQAAPLYLRPVAEQP